MNPRQLRRSLALLFAVNCLNFYDRQALGAVAEPIRHEFGLSDFQIGALTTCFTLLYAVAGVPLGRLADTRSRRKLLAAGVAVWSSLTALGGLAGGYALLLVSRLGVASGEAACAPAAASWIGDLFPPARRSGAMSVFMLGVPLGGALSFAITGPLAQALGWRAALALAAAPAMLLVPALLPLREPPRAAVAEEKAAPWRLFAIPTFRWMVASGAVINFALYAFSTFLPAFLTRFHGFSIAKSGFWAGIGTGAAGVLGGLAAGAWGDRAFARRKDGRMRAAALAALMAAPLAFAGIAMPRGAAAALPLIMTAYGLLGMYYGLVYSAMQDIVGPRLRGTAMSVYFLAMYLCGASFGPMLTGALSDRLARAAAGAGPFTEAARAVGLRQAMYVVPALALILAAVLYQGSRAQASS
jgi:MFS family permease